MQHMWPHNQLHGQFLSGSQNQENWPLYMYRASYMQDQHRCCWSACDAANQINAISNCMYEDFIFDLHVLITFDCYIN